VLTKEQRKGLREAVADRVRIGGWSNPSVQDQTLLDAIDALDEMEFERDAARWNLTEIARRIQDGPAETPVRAALADFGTGLMLKGAAQRDYTIAEAAYRTRSGQ